jgi:4-oxalocrotonate tautomerase
MPLMSVKVIEGVFKEARERVEGEAMHPVTWVVVEEVRSGGRGMGGRTLPTQDVLALAGSAPVG